MRKSRARKGFTLPEVLVTLAIVATLAAVLLPALNSQLSKGDAGRGASDLVSLQTAIGAFASDVRRYPGDLSDLVATPAGNDVLGNAYPASAATRWKGPYLSKSLVSGNLPTGFGATIQGTFRRQAVPASGAPTEFLRIDFTGISQADFNKVDEIIDETASSSTGQLQFTTVGGDTAKYYATPLQ